MYRIFLSSFFLIHLFVVEVSAITERQHTINKDKPNVILIVAESHRADALGSVGHTFVQTPNLDALAASGLQFTNAHVTTAICTVSRASILSGQHNARHGINDFGSSFSTAAFNETLPMLLKNEGYDLAWLGWFGVGKAPAMDAFDLWEEDIPWMENGVHNTDQIVSKANSWLEGRQDSDPFFMQLNFSAAHEIDPTADKPAYFCIQERFSNLYDDITIPVPAAADPQVWEGFPDFFRTDDNIGRKRWYGFFSDPELFQKNNKDYYRSVTGVDEAVAKVLKKLESLGMAENTIVVYTSDHGFSLGEHGMMGKWYPFQVSTRVPLIIHNPLDPTLKGKKMHNSFALNIDIAPTILGMVKSNVPQTMQGVNLVEMYKGNIAERESYFYEHKVIGAPHLPATEALVTTDYKYINFVDNGFEILYDLKNDPDEITNVVNRPEHSDALNVMRKLFDIERKNAR